MRENVGHIDRIVRAIIGPGLMALGAEALRRRRMAGALGVAVGAMVLESAITRVCPLNTALHLDTRSMTERIRDFRADVNQQSDRIESEYAAPITIDEATVGA
jgi:hypothetical protein